jgi:hypothetical protein
MDHATIQQTIRILLTETHSKLNKAACIAKTAEACAQAGSISEGARSRWQMVSETGRLQDAASRSIPLSRLCPPSSRGGVSGST